MKPSQRCNFYNSSETGFSPFWKKISAFYALTNDVEILSTMWFSIFLLFIRYTPAKVISSATADSLDTLQCNGDWKTKWPEYSSLYTCANSFPSYHIIITINHKNKLFSLHVFSQNLIFLGVYKQFLTFECSKTQNRT